jgi:hypothetical protein
MKINLPKPHRSRHFGPSPFSTPETLSEDWKITLISFAVMLVLATAAGLYLLYEARTPQVAATDQSGPKELPFSKAELKTVQQNRVEEESAFEILRTTPPITPDPSL